MRDLSADLLVLGGRFRLVRQIGEGGMGVVWEAIEVASGNRFAIKFLRNSASNPELEKRFFREAEAANAVRHPCILHVHEIGHDGGSPAFVMDLLEGESLSARIEREGKLTLGQTAAILVPALQALQAAHLAGVVHRDLKPDNIFVTREPSSGGGVLVLEFGIARLTRPSEKLTVTGTLMGTPLYMSPEQAEGKDDTDGRADIWSLGAVLYEALSGSAPFSDRGSYHATIVGILTSRPKLLFDAAPWIPKDIASVVDACLVHDRDARIKDAASFTQRLLEAYPAVLPDGTGRHTAVIIPQATAAVDATGDTEFFTSASMPAAARSSRPGSSSRPSNPADSRTASSGTKPVSSDASRTAAATPVSPSERETAPPTPLQMEGLASGENQTISSGGPKTAPLWPAPPHSSASGGVAMPGTPPVIEPLPMSEVAPDTTRDDLLAVRAERRRWIAVGALLTIVIAVAAAGFLLGRRSNNLPASPPVEPPRQVAPPPATESPKIEPAVVAPEPPKVETPKPLETAKAEAPVVKPRPRMRPRPPRDPAAPADPPKADAIEPPPPPEQPKSDPPAD